MRKYYTLCLRDDGDSKWRPEFGDYSRSTVQAELEAYTEHDYLRKNAKIIASGDSQAEIAAAVAELNGTCRHCDNPPLSGYKNCLACLEELGGDY